MSKFIKVTEVISHGAGHTLLPVILNSDYIVSIHESNSHGANSTICLRHGIEAEYLEQPHSMEVTETPEELLDMLNEQK